MIFQSQEGGNTVAEIRRSGIDEVTVGGNYHRRMVSTNLLHGFCQIGSSRCVANSIHRTAPAQDLVPVQSAVQKRI